MRKVPLAASLGFVGLLALGLAALRSTTDLGERAVFAVVLAIHSIGLVGTILRRGRDPAWLGFTVLGWSAFLVVATDHFGGTSGQNTLPTSDFAEHVFDVREPALKPPVVGGKILEDEPDPMADEQAHLAYLRFSELRDQRSERRRHFAAVADLLATLGAAVLGIPVGMLVAPRQPAPGEQVSPGPSTPAP